MHPHQHVGGMLTPIIDEPAKVTNSEVKQDDTHLFPIFDGDRNNLWTELKL